MIDIGLDELGRGDVRLLLDEHLADMYATSPVESVHALDHTALAAPNITFWTAREHSVLLGCGALKELSPTWGELKSMRTAPSARGRGVAALMLAHIVRHARACRMTRISLETGAEDYFAAARRLYHRAGFVECPPFAGYSIDPNSVYLTLLLNAEVAQQRPWESSETSVAQPRTATG